LHHHRMTRILRDCFRKISGWSTLNKLKVNSNSFS
jgi:hypothetical protein